MLFFIIVIMLWFVGASQMISILSVKSSFVKLFIMLSTTLFIGERPIEIKLSLIQFGDSLILTLEIKIPEYLGHASLLLTFTYLKTYRMLHLIIGLLI